MSSNTVLLCDKSWTILSFMGAHVSPDLSKGDQLIEKVSEPAQLAKDCDIRRHLTLTFPALGTSARALIKPFAKGYLVILSPCAPTADGIGMAELYEDAIAWARDCFESLFRDEYYQIHQLNNQLIDSKRSLARSNARLRQALDELEKTNAELETAQETAEKALDFAERANRSKTAFLSSVSHDIRTPLSAIAGFIELMEHDKNLTERQQSYLEKMHMSSDHLLGIINDVLDISRIESGKVVLSNEPFSILDQVEKIETIIRPQALDKHQMLAIDVKELSCDRLVGDAVRISQVMANLLSNAVKYTQEGGQIELKVASSPANRPNTARIRITVADNGCGMTPDFLERVFEPFARDRETESIQGTGLGMAITRNIVTLMGGTITVDSALGHGSRFEVEVELPVDNEPAPSANAKHNSPDATLAGLHILCAEDNSLNAEIRAAILEMEGASCLICQDGKELVKAFVASAPGEYDMILTDIQMPNMNGYDATRTIRALDRPDARSIPIIAMTANAFAEDAQACLDAGMDAHLSKPLDSARLAALAASFKFKKG